VLAAEDIERYHLHPLFEVIEKIARVCKVNFFSTEIALDSNGKFIAIDYVNEVCDMRPKSKHFDGVPDRIVEKIGSKIVDYVKEHLFNQQTIFK